MAASTAVLILVASCCSISFFNNAAVVEASGRGPRGASLRRPQGVKSLIENTQTEENLSRNYQAIGRDLLELQTDCYAFSAVFKEDSKEPTDEGLDCMEASIKENTAAIAMEYVVEKLHQPEAAVWKVEHIEYDDPTVVKLQKELKKVAKDQAKLKVQYSEDIIELETKRAEIEADTEESKMEEVEKVLEETIILEAELEIAKQDDDKKRVQALEKKLAKIKLEKEEKLSDIEEKGEEKLAENASKKEDLEQWRMEKELKNELKKKELSEQLEIAKIEAKFKKEEKMLKEKETELKEEKKLFQSQKKEEEEKKKEEKKDKKRGKSDRSLAVATPILPPRATPNMQPRNRRRRHFGQKHRARLNAMGVQNRTEVSYFATILCQEEYCRLDNNDQGRLLLDDSAVENFHNTTTFASWMEKEIEKALKDDCYLAKKELDFVIFSYVDDYEDFEL